MHKITIIGHLGRDPANAVHPGGPGACQEIQFLGGEELLCK